MRRLPILKTAASLACVTACIYLFQNCSNNNASFNPVINDFTTDPGTYVQDPKDYGDIDVPPILITPTKVIEQGVVDNELLYPKVDLIFVVDESVSMDYIINATQSGFAAVPGASYPPDVRIAVTNTHPAKVNGSSTNFNEAFVKNSKNPDLHKQPGFLKLVNRNTIQSYLSNHPELAKNFSIQGCASEWFRPTDKDANGVSCIRGATQVAYLGVGVEAGVTSVIQLAQKYEHDNKPLFRDDALVNVVFVSDTHDPGVGKVTGESEYYGLPNAPSRMPSLIDTTESIRDGSPNILTVKYSGIVPLPLLGSPLLDGLLVVGMPPRDTSQVSPELTHDFSYLNLIEPTLGVALHPTSGNWQDGIQRLVNVLGRAKDIIVRLEKDAAQILVLKVEGEAIATNQYRLKDPRTIIINKNLAWPRKLDVYVEYKPK